MKVQAALLQYKGAMRSSLFDMAHEVHIYRAERRSKKNWEKKIGKKIYIYIAHSIFLRGLQRVKSSHCTPSLNNRMDSVFVFCFLHLSRGF